ncbi:hypothetical protein VitviT2T_030573 [Vitis vinifera]|uniref:Rx N-terminal domain-containing protein n=1 Tax=Vitis vinifera TaxID=29760 RepID=A0ABY9E0H8_VITVI|nr:hypothetical protein VitviT2T_030573 [Vitis vinifera]
MAEQIPFNIIADVLTKLGSSAIQQIGSAFGVAKELTKLTEKLDAIRGVLLDAEEKQEKSHAVKTWVRRLKDVVYDADDLLDDFATHQLQRGGVARQVSDFFSSSNQLVYRFKMSSRVKNIKEEVDEIVKEIDLLKLVQGNIVHRELTSLRLPPSLLSQLDIRYCGDLASLELHSSPLLSSLDIRNCPQLTSLLFPPSPCLEKLYLCKVKEVVLRELMLATASSLESVSVESIDDLMSLPDELRQHVSTLQTLKIWDCSRLATIPRWIGNLTSLTELGIGYCPELTSLAQEMRSLTNLRSLSIDYSCGLASSPNWIGGLTSLTDLEICSYSQLTSLPKELRSLGILKSLTIHDWSGLTTLPDWIGSLTSLTDLEIGPCPALTITARGIVLF